MYKPHTTSDRKRYVEEVMLEAPIFFVTEHPYQEGILLKDALHSRTKKLVDRDQVVFEGRGPSVSIRLEVSSLIDFRPSINLWMSFSGLDIGSGAGKFLPRISAVPLNLSL